MKRPGLMAPPTLAELPRGPGLMAPDRDAVPHEPSLRMLLWCIAGCLGAVELLVGAVKL
jgi:hypothetical protein